VKIGKGISGFKEENIVDFCRIMRFLFFENSKENEENYRDLQEKIEENGLIFDILYKLFRLSLRKEVKNEVFREISIF